MARLDEIAKTISSNVPESSEVFIENYGFGSKGQVVYQGELGGIIRLELWRRGIPYRNVPPTKCKKFLTGKGIAEKSLVMKELYKKFAIDVDDDNQADAIVLNLIGQAINGCIQVTAAQREVLIDIKQEK